MSHGSPALKWEQFRVQADMDPDTKLAPAVTEVVTTTFSDEAKGVSEGFSEIRSNFTLDDANVRANLSNFLARPVRIDSYTWLETDPIGITRTISPWYLFFNDPSIKYKLNNFAFVKCDLKIKVIVNASPFYYGAQRVCYQPLPAFKPSTIGTGVSSLIPLSQQPGIWINPMSSQGGEMTLPFFFQKDYLSVQRAADFTNMGTLRYVTYAALDSANGVTGAGVSVQVYAWAENVVLSGPSVGVSMQGDEYGQGIVSRPASIVSHAAGLLKSVPVIGKFATATEMGAKAISGIAKLFGFTNVPVIEDTKPVRPSPFPQLASPELGYPVEKLTLDAKNELSIDPSIVGLPSDDPLAIQNLATRDSYLTGVTWSTTTPVDTPLFTSLVTPNLFLSNGSLNTNGNALYLTPSAMVAAMFKYWRGDMIFKFTVVASKYHKGRLRVSYDPVNAGVQTTGDTGSVVFNKIVDIGEEPEFEVRIPYHQALPWLTCDLLSTATKWTGSSTPTLAINSEANGILSMKVLTLLTAPIAVAPVRVLVSVRAADNIEFSTPDVLPRISPFAVQSDSEYTPGTVSDLNMDRYKVNFGECVRSVRPLLRRANANEVLYNSFTPAGAYRWYKPFFRYPRTFGYDPDTVTTAKGVITTANTYPFNYGPMTPYHIVSNCFVAQRGSIMWHFVPESTNPISNLSCYRSVSGSATSQGVLSQDITATVSGVNSTLPYTTAGVALTNCRTQDGLSVSLPNMTNYKFQSTRPNNGTRLGIDTDTSDGANFETAVINFTATQSTTPFASVKIHTFFGVGTDYTPLFFLNVPVMYQIATAPVPS